MLIIIPLMYQCWMFHIYVGPFFYVMTLHVPVVCADHKSSIDLAMFDTEDDKSSSVDVKIFDI
jgi:hypothetical protein